MKYVVIVDIDSSLLEGDDSIENACNIINEALDKGSEGIVPPTVRPLSEEIAC